MRNTLKLLLFTTMLFITACESKELSQEQLRTKKEFILLCIEKANGSKGSVEQCRMTASQLLGY